MEHPVLFSFTSKKPLFHGKNKKPLIKLFKKVILFYFKRTIFKREDDDYNRHDFNSEATTFIF